MAEASIPVDLLNPGQVFACLGFLEAADVLMGSAAGGFDWSEEAAVRFRLSANAAESPFRIVLLFLERASVSSLAPYGSPLDTSRWGVPTRALTRDDPFAFDEPDSPATLPAVLAAGDDRFLIEHWGEESRRTGRDTVKFWAGAGGYPGAALARDALDLARPMLRSITPDPFAAAVIQTSSFRFDWRRDYIPIDAGFSLNNHGDAIRPRGYPVVELLAAMGLRYARPARLNRLEYKYGVVGRSPGESADSAILPTQFLRAALGCADLPFSSRTFHMCLGWPGQEGQARSVTSVYEENQ